MSVPDGPIVCSLTTMTASADDDLPWPETDVVLVGAVPDPVVHPQMSATISTTPPRTRLEIL
jgi:hypothetical protein